MTEITSLLNTLQTISPLGIVALMAVIILMLVKGNPWKKIDRELTTIQQNHLHELPAMAANIRALLDSQQRMETGITRLTTIIDERLPKH